MREVLLSSEIGSLTPYLDDGIFKYIRESQTVSFEGFNDHDILAFNWYDVKSENESNEKVTVYLDNDNLFFFCESERSRDYIKKITDPVTKDSSISDDRCLYLFFAQLLKGDMDYLEKFEDLINDSETAILSGDSHDALEKIISWRHELLRLKHYYEQLDAIFDEITANDNGLLPADILTRIVILGQRTDRYLNKVVSLQEMISQLREAYQSQLSIQQNDLMKVFTIVTAVFLPLTLLTGWFGMNFVNMPELSLPWGYPVMIIVSILIVISLLLYFKHKKWL